MESSIKECLLCEFLKEKEDEEIVLLKCCHTFCWTCLSYYLEKNLNSQIKCPIASCTRSISDNIIRKTLSPENIKRYENICLNGIKQSHNCFLDKCSGIISYTDPNLQYECLICSLYNCICCSASHSFYTCTQYQSLSPQEKKYICEVELTRASKVLGKVNREKMKKLLKLEEEQLFLVNEYAFTCSLCSCSLAKKQGIKLRDCPHVFCQGCLTGHIHAYNLIPVKCPEENCQRTICDRDIQGLLSLNELKIYMKKCNSNLKGKLRDYLHCKLPDCDSLYCYSKKPESFQCVNCSSINCVLCGDIHDHRMCQIYQNGQRNKSEEFIKSQIKEGKLMKCLDCKTLLKKTDGCNWISCPNCGIELCWITQQYRWGPKGPGDTSGGCRCGVGGVKCVVGCKGCIPDVGRRHSRYAQDSGSNIPAQDSGCSIM